MEQLRSLLKDAYDERAELATEISKATAEVNAATNGTTEISRATAEVNVATNRYQQWERGFLMKRVCKASFAARKEAIDTATAKLAAANDARKEALDTATAKLAEMQEQLRLTILAMEIAVDREQAEPYYRMRDDFAGLAECRKVWNVLAEEAVDRFVTRSTAETAITRDQVSFSLDSCDLIQWDQKVPHLPNRTGGDMFVYPGFILYRASKQAFALIDSRDVSLRYVATRFNEPEAIPSDTQTIGQTWAKSNKDGSPDRRFVGNHQIPVVGYGTLLFTSPSGLDVRYMCSNVALAERFVKAWTAFRASFWAGSDPGPLQNPGQLLDEVKRFFAVHNDFKSNINKGTMPMQDFMAYMAAAMRYVAVQKRYADVVDRANLHAAATTIRCAIEVFEVARAHFGESVKGGRMNGTELTAYLNAFTDSSDAIAQVNEDTAPDQASAGFWA